MTLHIVSGQLRELVLQDVTAKYVLMLEIGSGDVPEFEEFFDAYRDGVEQGLDPIALRAGEHMMEYRRVWTNHAVWLGERQLRQARRAGRASRRRK